MRLQTRFLAPLLATAFVLAACDKEADKKVDDKKAAKKADDKKVDDKKVDDQKAPEVAPPQPEPTPAVVLTLGAAKIMEKDKPDEAIEIAADGTVKMGPEPDKTLKISTDGKISKADGTVVGQVAGDGAVSFDGQPSGVVLVDTGLTLTTPDGKTTTLKFGDDGSVIVEPANPDAPQMQTEGCTGPMAKTCGLVMTLLLFHSEGPTTGAEAEAKAEPSVVEAVGDEKK